MDSSAVQSSDLTAGCRRVALCPLWEERLSTEDTESTEDREESESLCALCVKIVGTEGSEKRVAAGFWRICEICGPTYF
jgi:hypothetical protein